MQQFSDFVFNLPLVTDQNNFGLVLVS